MPGVDPYFVIRFRAEVFDARLIDNEARFNEYGKIVARVWRDTLGGKLPLSSTTYDTFSRRLTSNRGFVIEAPSKPIAGVGLLCGRIKPLELASCRGILCFIEVGTRV